MKAVFIEELKKFDSENKGLKHDADFSKSELINFIKSNDRILHSLIQHLRYKKALVYDKTTKTNKAGQDSTEAKQKKNKTIDTCIALLADESKEIKWLAKKLNKTENNLRVQFFKSKLIKIKNKKAYLINSQPKTAEQLNKELLFDPVDIEREYREMDLSDPNKIIFPNESDRDKRQELYDYHLSIGTFTKFAPVSTKMLAVAKLQAPTPEPLDDDVDW